MTPAEFRQLTAAQVRRLAVRWGVPGWRTAPVAELREILWEVLFA